ncbi:glycosyltransferase family 4 protein [Bacillus sp. z60-11]|uniref:glycosyltransferase family 4 protein n=1 Tax=Bacillus sp. z60-11 TaxID=3377704 RepID=UPI00396C7608
MMKVLMLSLENPCAIKSGAGRYLQNQLDLLKEDIMFTVLTTHRGERCFDGGGQWKTLEIPLELAAHASFEDALAEMNIQMIKKTFEYKGSFDIIHAHDDVTAPAAVYLKRALNLPLISTVHGFESDRQKAAGRKAHPYRLLLERLLLKESGRIIVLSSMMKDFVKERSPEAAEKVRIIPNPCRKTKTVKSRPKTAPYLFSYGRFVPEKGFLQLIRAFNELARLQDGLELVIAGEGPLKSAYEREARSLGMEDRLTVLPFLSDQERENWLGFCEMAVFPSGYEPFGIAVQESMAAGVPVAVGKTGGWNDFVMDFKTGFHIDFTDAYEAGRKLDGLLRNKAALRKVRQAGKAFIFDLHHPERIKKSFLKGVYSPSFE